MNEKFTKEKNDKQAREITGNSPAAARLGARAHSRARLHALAGAMLTLVMMFCVGTDLVLQGLLL